MMVGAMVCLLQLATTAEAIQFPPLTNCVYDLTSVRQAFSSTLAQAHISNGSLLVLKEGQKLFEQYAGVFNASTPRPIASGTKWLSAVVIMSLVDDGLMSLDDPVSKFFPQSYTGLKGTMTVRQMFSHTSGLPGGLDYPVLNDDSITLQQAAQIISTPDEINRADLSKVLQQDVARFTSDAGNHVHIERYHLL